VKPETAGITRPGAGLRAALPRSFACPQVGGLVHGTVDCVGVQGGDPGFYKNGGPGSRRVIRGLVRGGKKTTPTSGTNFSVKILFVVRPFRGYVSQKNGSLPRKPLRLGSLGRTINGSTRKGRARDFGGPFTFGCVEGAKRFCDSAVRPPTEVNQPNKATHASMRGGGGYLRKEASGGALGIYCPLRR